MSDRNKTHTVEKPAIFLNEEEVIRLFRHIKITSSCWIWLTPRPIAELEEEHPGTIRQYTAMKFRKVKHQANQIMYRWVCGPIPPRHRLMTSCKNPLCMNPEHMYLKDQEDPHKGFVEDVNVQTVVSLYIAGVSIDQIAKSLKKNGDQITTVLARYSKKHPEAKLNVF